MVSSYLEVFFSTSSTEVRSAHMVLPSRRCGRVAPGPQGQSIHQDSLVRRAGVLGPLHHQFGGMHFWEEPYGRIHLGCSRLADLGA